MSTGALFTRKEVAVIFNVQPHTVTQWARRGVIKPTCYVNGRPRYTVEELEKVAKVKTPAHESQADQSANEQPN